MWENIKAWFVIKYRQLGRWWRSQKGKKMPDNKKNNVSTDKIAIPLALQESVKRSITDYDNTTLAILAEAPPGLSLGGDGYDTKLARMKEKYYSAKEAIENLKDQENQNALIASEIHLTPAQAKMYLIRLNRHYAQLLLLGFVQAADAALAQVVADTAANPVALDKYVLKESEKKIQQIFNAYESRITQAIYESLMNNGFLGTWTGTKSGEAALDHYFNALKSLKLLAQQSLQFEKANQDLQRLLTRFDPLLSYGTIHQKNFSRGSCLPQSVLKPARKDIRRLLPILIKTVRNLGKDGLCDRQQSHSNQLTHPFTTENSQTGIVMQTISQKHLAKWRDQGRPIFKDGFADSMNNLEAKIAPREHWVWIVLKNLVITCLNSDKKLLRKIKKPHDLDEKVISSNIKDNDNSYPSLTPSLFNSIELYRSQISGTDSNDDDNMHTDDEKRWHKSGNNEYDAETNNPTNSSNLFTEIFIDDGKNELLSEEKQSCPSMKNSSKTEHLSITTPPSDNRDNLLPKTTSNDIKNNSDTCSVSVIGEDGTEELLEPIQQIPSYQRDYAEWLQRNPKATFKEFNAFMLQHIDTGLLQVKEEQTELKQQCSTIKKEGIELYKKVNILDNQINKIQDVINHYVHSTNEHNKKLDSLPSTNTQTCRLKKTNSTDSLNNTIALTPPLRNSI